METMKIGEPSLDTALGIAQRQVKLIMSLQATIDSLKNERDKAILQRDKALKTLENQMQCTKESHALQAHKHTRAN